MKSLRRLAPGEASSVLEPESASQANIIRAARRHKGTGKAVRIARIAAQCAAFAKARFLRKFRFRNVLTTLKA